MKSFLNIINCCSHVKHEVSFVEVEEEGSKMSSTKTKTDKSNESKKEEKGRIVSFKKYDSDKLNMMENINSDKKENNNTLDLENDNFNEMNEFRNMKNFKDVIDDDFELNIIKDINNTLKTTEINNEKKNIISNKKTLKMSNGIISIKEEYSNLVYNNKYMLSFDNNNEVSVSLRKNSDNRKNTLENSSGNLFTYCNNDSYISSNLINFNTNIVILDSEIKSAKKIILEDFTGNLLYGKQLFIDAGGMKNGLRKKRDGFTFLGFEPEEVKF